MANTANGIVGANLLSSSITNCAFNDLLTAGSIAETNPISYFRSNIINRCNTGFDIQTSRAAVFQYNQFNTFYDDAIKGENVLKITSQGDVINGSGGSDVDGMDFNNVRVARLTDSEIMNCSGNLSNNTGNGIRGHQTNVILGGGSQIHHNTAGVLFEGNATADYMLAVGKCQCAHIYRNIIGVRGENIILEIDSEENQIACNEADLLPNSFQENTKIFDICYTDPNFNLPGPILMKSNYWGGGPLQNYNYTIKHINCSQNAPVDASNHVVFPLDLDACEEEGGLIGELPKFDIHDLEKVAYSFLNNGTTHNVHTQFRLAYRDLHNGDFVAAEAGFQPVASLNKAIHTASVATHKIDVSRCIVKALQDINQQALLYSSHWNKNALSEQAKNTNQQKLFGINPTVVTNDLRVENYTGEPNWDGGIYFTILRDDKGATVQTKRVIVR